MTLPVDTALFCSSRLQQSLSERWDRWTLSILSTFSKFSYFSYAALDLHCHTFRLAVTLLFWCPKLNKFGCNFSVLLYLLYFHIILGHLKKTFCPCLQISVIFKVKLVINAV